MTTSLSVAIMNELPHRLPIEMVNRILEYTECNGKICILNINTPQVKYIGRIAGWAPYSAVSALYGDVKVRGTRPNNRETDVEHWYEVSVLGRWCNRGVYYKTMGRDPYRCFARIRH